MGVLKQIIEGHINEFKSAVGLTTEEQERVYASRARICSNCPLKSGNTCNPTLAIHPVTMEVVPMAKKKPGFIQGCGCRLTAKQKAPGSACPAGFWGKEYKK